MASGKTSIKRRTLRTRGLPDGELAILRGAPTIIAESSPIVAFELGNAAPMNYPYTATYYSADYFDFFAARGYKSFSMSGISLSRDEFLSAAEGQFFWNYVAVPDQGPWPFDHASSRVLVQQRREAAAPSIEQVVAESDDA